MPTPFWLTPLYRPEAISLGGYTVLTNVGTGYDSVNPSRGLGLASADFTNVASVEFGLQVNKIGSGTQSWQLWNETNGVEIGVIDDAGVAGNKTLGPITITTGLPTGQKLVRVRAKSTTGADDPVYYGAYIVLR